MARKIFIAGNWKMNKTAAEAKALCEALKESLGKTYKERKRQRSRTVPSNRR